MAEEELLYCLCRRSYNEEEFMIECDVCHDWFHGNCVGIEEHQAPDIDSYHCPNCQPEHGPLTLKRRRNWHRHDYSEINDGNKAVQSGTVMFVSRLKKKKFSDSSEILTYLKGSEVTPSYFDSHGFSNPIMVEEKEGLKLKLPPRSFRISDVEKCVGSMRELDVIDVARQDDIHMTMREWTEYYEVVKPRKKILNVISLEFSGTELSQLVTPPLTVRKIDWINCHWPEELPDDCTLSRPSVQKYCLMSVKDSYTDFHVDFGGTSVWYHVLWGEKIFYLIPPSDSNLIHYEQWVLSADQSEVFFGDLVSKCYICRVKQGNTLFIPSGWIHAVLTPEDSLVFGGNFIHSYAIQMQLRIYEMEHRLRTPMKFRHPCYEALIWFAAKNILAQLKEYSQHDAAVPDYLLEGLREIRFSLHSWIRTREKLKAHAAQIPPTISPTALVDKIQSTLSSLKSERSDGPSSCKPKTPARNSPIRMVINKDSGRAGFSSKPVVKKRLVSPEYSSDSSESEPEDQSNDEETSELTRLSSGRTVKRRKWNVDSLVDKDEDYAYAVEDENESDHILLSGDVKDSKMKRDDLWTPRGSSKPARPVMKRSYEPSLSPAAAKILKMEEQKAALPGKSGLVCVGGGSLSESKSVASGGRSRAAAAADAVNAMVTAAKPKAKLLTAKQRLGKIMGIKSSGSRWKT